MKKQKYLIICPKCNSSHNVSKQMNIWRDEFVEEINKTMNKLKGARR